MPKFIKTDALRMFESSIESYILALTGYNLPKIKPKKIPDTRYAPIMGLLGAVVELLAKGCLVQAKGKQVLYRDGAFYKYGSETLQELKGLVKNEDIDIAFLWESVEDKEVTKAQLIDSLDKFKLLQQYRANGLHAGIGASRDVVSVVFSDVFEFINTLAECKRFRYLLKELPHIDEPIIDRAAILEDLSRRIKASEELGVKASLLRAIYMVLPKLPESEPEWLEKIEKVSVIPNEEDISYLLKNMTETHGIHLYKDRGSRTEGVPVFVDTKNPDAVPILPFYLKRELTQINDQFYADLSTANGRLNQSGYLSLPPDDFVIDLFAIDILEVGLIPEGYTHFTAQQVWPFIASALNVQGIHRPCWFLVRKCDELHKLKSCIEKAVDKGGAYLRNNSKFIIEGINAILSDVELSNSETIKKFTETYDKTKYSRDRFTLLFEGKEEAQYELPEGYKEAFEKFIAESKALGDIIVALISKSELEEDEKYWIRQALHALNRYEDKNGLVALYGDTNFETYKSEIRKLMRLIDFLEFGPRSSMKKE